MSTVLSHVGLQGIRDQVRSNALESFEFFCNTVVAAGLPGDLCATIQDALQDHEDYLIHTARPRAAAVAIAQWLNAQGIPVLCAVPLPDCEVLRWLSLGEVSNDQPHAVSLDVKKTGVLVQWI